MQTKTLIKRVLGGLIAINGLLNPYSFLHYAQDYSDNTMNTAVSHDTEHTSVDSSAFDKISLGFYANTAHAATESEKELAGTLEAFLKVIYVLLWPLLWIAGIAMDNSLVYGEYFGLDNALFKFWSIMKNFANFALGFLFVRSIVSYVINPNEKKNPKDMITKLLVAGVGVQLSWFLIGALVDLSTVLTVGIGGLPLQLISNDSELAQKPVLGVKTSVKLNDQIGSTSNLVVLYTWPGGNFSQASFENPEGQYLLPCYIEGQKVDFSRKWPHAFGVATANATNTDGTINETANIAGTDNITWKMIVQDFCIVGNNIVHKSTYTSRGTPSLGDPTMGEIFKESQKQISTKSGCDNNDACQTMKTFAKSSEGYQGAFYSLYASLLGLSTIHIGVPKSTTSLIMETLIKTIVGLAYLIPLAILCIVLIMRVGYLWLIIAFSPFIILASVKDLGIKKIDGGFQLGDIKTKFNLTNVISLLLLPVIVTFTISLSIVFLGSLSEGLTKGGGAEALGMYQRTDGNYKCYDIAITDICIDMPAQDIGSGIFDYFSWFIMNLFGVGLMWFAVMAALQSSDFTKGVAQSVQKLSESMLGNAPIIPVGGGTSLNALQEMPNDIQRNLRTGQQANQNVLANIIEGKVNDLTGKDKAGNEEMNTLIADNSKQAHEKLISLASNDDIKGKKLDFQQYDNATSFANNLLDTGWKDITDKNGKPIAKPSSFTSGKDLFTTQGGQQLLAGLLDKSGANTGDLQTLFSSKDDVATTKEWEKIKGEIDALRKPKPQTPTFTKVPFIKSNREEVVVGIENNILKIAKAGADRSTATEIGSIDATQKQPKATWEKISTTLSEIKKENANKLDGKPWDTLLTKVIETTDSGKIKFVEDATTGQIKITPVP